jgi:hypothetical protein
VRSPVLQLAISGGNFANEGGSAAAGIGTGCAGSAESAVRNISITGGYSRSKAAVICITCVMAVLQLELAVHTLFSELGSSPQTLIKLREKADQSQSLLEIKAILAGGAGYGGARGDVIAITGMVILKREVRRLRQQSVLDPWINLEQMEH